MCNKKIKIKHCVSQKLSKLEHTVYKHNVRKGMGNMSKRDNNPTKREVKLFT